MSRREPKTVLIADDDRDLVNVLSVRCRRLGLKVLVAYDAFTALSLARSRTPDVICLDIEMPAGNGLCVCEMLASDESFRQTPIIMLTGRTDPDTIVRCHTLCAYYVEKCTNTWSRVEPLLRELVELPETPGTTAPDVGGEPATRRAGGQAADDIPNSQPASPPASECETTPQPSPGAAMTDRAESSAQQSEDSAGTASPVDDRQADASQPFASESQESDRVWRHFAHALGRFVTTSGKSPRSQAGRPARTDRDADATVPAEPAVQRESGKPIEWRLDQDDVVPVRSLDEMWTEVSGGAGRTNAPKEQETTPTELAEESMTDQQPADPTILIADDDSDLVQMLVLRCGQMGIRVFRSPDAMHALLGVHRVRPNLVILDVNMPGGNGLSVCEMLAGDETLKKIPVIVITGDTNEEIPRRCQALRAQFVEKGAGLWERIEPVIRRCLRLPAPAAANNPNGASDSVEKRVDGRPRILCIDDDPDISKILKLRLDTYGVDVIRAFNGMQGYWTALDMQPNLIILDMVMPDGAGNYILGRLRSHPLTEKTPVIMLTGLNTPGVRRQMFGLGIDAYLTKPLDFQALLEHVRQYIPLEKEIGPTDAPQSSGGPEATRTETPQGKTTNHVLVS